MNNDVFYNRPLRMDERLSDVDWPQIIKIDVPSVKKIDCMLVCAGFEDRSVEALRRIRDAGKSGFSLGLVSYLPEQPENREDELYAISRDAALEVTRFVYDRENPAGIGKKLKDFTQGFGQIFIDISGMSRLLIVQTLAALIYNQNQQVSIIYGEADKYPPFKAEFQQQNNIAEPVFSYLTSGIIEIALTPELSSVAMQGEPLRLVAFPSFNPSQLTNLIHELQPAYLELIHGIPPSQENQWRKSVIRDLNFSALDGLYRIENEHDASTLDYRETLHKLLEIYTERNMFDRIVISPTGSKMQAVAVSLFRAALHDIQIVYPTPQVFTAPEEHTLGLRQLYQLDIPAEAFSDAIGNSKDDSSSSFETHS